MENLEGLHPIAQVIRVLSPVIVCCALLYFLAKIKQD